MAGERQRARSPPAPDATGANPLRPAVSSRKRNRWRAGWEGPRETGSPTKDMISTMVSAGRGGGGCGGESSGAAMRRRRRGSHLMGGQRGGASMHPRCANRIQEAYGGARSRGGRPLRRRYQPWCSSTGCASCGMNFGDQVLSWSALMGLLDQILFGKCGCARHTSTRTSTHQRHARGLIQQCHVACPLLQHPRHECYYWDQKLQLLMSEMFSQKLANSTYGKISGMVFMLVYVSVSTVVEAGAAAVTEDQKEAWRCAQQF